MPFTPSEKTFGAPVRISGKGSSVLSRLLSSPYYSSFIGRSKRYELKPFKIMGAAILRLSKLQAKWSTKLTATLASKPKNMGGFTKKYAMALLPFITVLREGLEAVVFVGGVSISSPASAFPLPVITGLIAGGIIGWIIYKGGNTVKVQMFLVASTAVLYLVAAGLFSRAVWDFEMWQYGRLVGGDVAETGTGPGSYDIRKSVWHVNCCSPTFNQGGGWGIFNASKLPPSTIII